MIDHVFVYGTLLPGDVRWSYLEQFVADEGRPDSVERLVVRHRFRLSRGRLRQGREHDPRPDVRGRRPTVSRSASPCSTSRRTRSAAGTDGSAIRTLGGIDVWAYEYGFGLDLTPIPSGDWLAHRPAHLALELTDD